MRSSEKVLNSLAKHSQQPDYKFERLYRLLFNEQIYYVAYQRIYAKEGNMTKGADNATIDHMSISRIEKLITSLKNETYQPIPSRRVYIPKKNGKKRPLGIPTFNDKLLQEVVRMILEAIYEGSFDANSHGFRPKRSCHTALRQIQQTFNGARWFIEGDIKGFFDNINHDVMISILRKRIDDERFIRLIRKFLNAGYIEDWVFNKAYRPHEIVVLSLSKHFMSLMISLRSFMFVTFLSFNTASRFPYSNLIRSGLSFRSFPLSNWDMYSLI